MGVLVAAAADAPFRFLRWNEVFVSSDKGRREVHYYLKRSDGSSDLAVVGKEKSLRHMSYHYAHRIRSLFSMSSLVKLKSRREVIDWLDSVVADTAFLKSPDLGGSVSDGKDAYKLGTEIFKDTVLRKLGKHTTEFLWLGSPWTCRKKRRHYQSFSRNGVVVSVHDFVFVLAEEDKRLVAYLEDMYEDSRGNKMVVVRWFHKVDEVGIVLPHNFNDREIFFSLCLQDLSIECIDGLATVLSPQHFEKFKREATQTLLKPFVCQKQFENDDVQPFDITQVQGYWKQEILRYMHTLAPSKAHGSSQQPDEGLEAEENDGVNGIRPKKRHRSSQNDDMRLEFRDWKESPDAVCDNVENLSQHETDCRSKSKSFCLVRGGSSVLPHKEVKKNPQQHLVVGSQVEVLSQDSGIRGCWFKALIIKRYRDKVKVQYQDIQDAADEAKKLEEWILASRLAASDQFGLRTFGRPIVRPSPPSSKGRVSWAVDVGTVVDVWWNDGWWEGIVVQKEPDERLHVYFPGEKRVLIVGHGELRHSQEWLGIGWAQIKDRPELVSSISCNLETKQVVGKSSDCVPTQSAVCDSEPLKKEETGCNSSVSLDESDKDEKVKEPGKVPDLLKDGLLAQLKWKSSRKRRRGNGSSVQKLHCIVSDGKSARRLVGSGACESFKISSSLKVDRENCKYLGDSLFSSSVAPPLTSLVM
ncbi:uncharacterized protein LOC103947416 [Pyrus x bretschneideri]|uniref:uncharacterized protein LOC103947416 n=1 Tax=Pyrus x bretschneideri TaxID=225117 RepID=UPI002030144E|nr:uncharacterized protein LOC103947416 [Pyrus x bretschneideri]